MLAQGKLHVDLLDADFPGEAPEGAEALVAQVRTALNKRFRTADRMPGVIFTDRGRGFYEPNSGKMTEQYSRGLRAHNLRALMGENAAVQPGSMQGRLHVRPQADWIIFMWQHCNQIENFQQWGLTEIRLGLLGRL